MNDIFYFLFNTDNDVTRDPHRSQPLRPLNSQCKQDTPTKAKVVVVEIPLHSGNSPLVHRCHPPLRGIVAGAHVAPVVVVTAAVVAVKLVEGG